MFATCLLDLHDSLRETPPSYHINNRQNTRFSKRRTRGTSVRCLSHPRTWVQTDPLIHCDNGASIARLFGTNERAKRELILSKPTDRGPPVDACGMVI